MRYALIFISVAFLLACFSCSNSRSYDKSIKALDSLKVVLQQSLDNFESIDSTSCFNAHQKLVTYLSFIESHLSDTISRIEAEQIQYFQAVKPGFDTYVKYREEWIIKAEQSVIQLNNLSADLKSGNVGTSDATNYINTETQNAQQAITTLKQNTERIRKHLEIYNRYVSSCETIIKRINAGILPQIITTNQ